MTMPGKNFDNLFRISILIKGLDAIIEVIGGLLLFFVTPPTVANWGQEFTTDILHVGSHSYLGHLILHSTADISTGSTIFGAIYLLSHGLIKLVVIIALLKNKLWAYPALIVVLSAFIIFQLYKLFDHLTLGLSLLTVFDVFVIILTWIEYKKQLALRAHQKTLKL